jgi:hypothetical protein
MNLQEKEADMIAPVEAENINRLLDDLPGLGFAEDDIREQLEATARRGIQHIANNWEDEYRVRHDCDVLPQSVWRVLRSRAYHEYIKHCRRLIADLGEAADKPNLRF